MITASESATNTTAISSERSRYCRIARLPDDALRSRQRDALELELERDRQHPARRFVHQGIVGHLARDIDEQVLEPEVATIGRGLVESAVQLMLRPVALLKVDAIIEQ